MTFPTLCDGGACEPQHPFPPASLHAVPNLMDGRDIRMELLMVAQEAENAAANVVATAAFCVIKDGWLAARGVVFPNAVREYFPETTVPHLMWTEPFDFADLGTFSVDGMDETVHALQVVPLTEPERALLHEHGFDALSSRLESAEARHFDLYRESVC